MLHGPLNVKLAVGTLQCVQLRLTSRS